MESSQPQVPQSINLMTLPVQELKHIADQMQQEVDLLSTSMQSLKAAQTQYVQSKDTLNTMKNENKGKDILVPMSSSLYVPGKLNDVENVMVDIGTGYFVEKNIQDAEEFFKRKIDYLKQQIESVQNVLQQKFQSKQVVSEALQTKLMHAQSQKS